MPLTGFYILGTGVAIGATAFVFALVNMGTALQGRRSMGGLMGGHLGAMGVMAVGGFIAFGGVLTAIVNAIQTYG